MSMDKNYYVIAGYDLTGWESDTYADWKWTDEGEKWRCYQSNGNVQIFDDPCCGNHFYLGYILAHGDEYEFETTSIDPTDIDIIKHEKVDPKLRELYDLGAVYKYYGIRDQFKIFVFEEVY